MKKISANATLAARLASDSVLQILDYSVLAENYESVSERFHQHFSVGRDEHHQNALFHKIRYLKILERPWTGRVLDVGNDKPFLSFFLRKFNPDSVFETISNEIPETPFDLYEVDIEREPLPFDVGRFDQIIFTEVIEHLWRDPAYCVCEMNRVLKEGGQCYVTTPNPCDRHALVCILWQANPNQRSGYFSSLESGHLHLWTAAHLKLLFECHGFSTKRLTTENLYGHTKDDENIEEFIARISPYAELMNEAVVLETVKKDTVARPVYPSEIFPDDGPVLVQGAIVGFLADAQLPHR